MSSAATIYRKVHPEYYKQEHIKDNLLNLILFSKKLLSNIKV